MESDSLQLLLAQGMSVERIARRFGKDPSTVSYWMAKHGLHAPNRDKHAAKGGIPRERLKELVEAGLTIQEIACSFELSKSTVRHWLRRYGLRTRNGHGRRPAEASRQSKAEGLLTTRMKCSRHGWAQFVLEGRGYYRCKRCRMEAVARRRRRVKSILVAEAGGCCRICGYDRHLGALEFHHVDPQKKRLQISWNGVTLALDRVRAEVRKCILLCSNCHAEVEGGVTTLPAKVPP